MSSEQYFHQSQWESPVESPAQALAGWMPLSAVRWTSSVGSSCTTMSQPWKWMEMGCKNGHGSCNDEILRVSSSMNIADSPRRDGHPIFFFRDTHISGKPSWLWDDHSPWIPCSAHGTCEQWQKSLMKYQCCYMGLYNLVYWGLLYVVVLAHTRENMGYIWANWHNGI